MSKIKGMLTSFSELSGSGIIEACNGKQYGFYEKNIVGSVESVKLYANIEFESSAKDPSVAKSCRVMDDEEVNTFIIPHGVHLCNSLKLDEWEILDVLDHEISHTEQMGGKQDRDIALSNYYPGIKDKIVRKTQKLNSNAILNFSYGRGGSGAIAKGIPAVIGLRSVLGKNSNIKEMFYRNIKSELDTIKKEISTKKKQGCALFVISYLLGLRLYAVNSTTGFDRPESIVIGLFMALILSILVMIPWRMFSGSNWVKPLDQRYSAKALNLNPGEGGKFSVNVKYFMYNPHETYYDYKDLNEAKEAKEVTAYEDIQISETVETMKEVAKESKKIQLLTFFGMLTLYLAYVIIFK